MIQLAFPFSLWDRIKASFVLIPERRANIVIHSIIPLMGVGVFILALTKERHVADAFLLMVVCFLITPVTPTNFSWR